MAKASVRKMRDCRRRVREPGLPSMRLWVPDLRDPGIRRRLERQARKLAQVPADPEIEALLESNLAEIEGWTA
jgi:hypothetical protein